MNIKWMALMLMGAAPALGLQPSELALIVNENSPTSLEMANHYQQFYDLPPENIFYVSVARRSPTAVFEQDLGSFREQVLNPVLKAISDRGLSDRILAWAYSADFPVKVIEAGKPAVSLQGATLTRGRIPGKEMIDTAQYVSPFFAGNADAATWIGIPNSLASLPPNGSIPSIMIGYAEARGLTQEEMISLFHRSRLANGTFPRGSVWFVTRNDIRSQCREWQYPVMASELARNGITTGITNSIPFGCADIIGLMIGAQAPEVWLMKPLMAGAMADHLTSGAALFDWPYQLKLTEWLRLGAAGAAGTVSEPYANWMKFPAASFYHYYLSGCSLLESFFQSVRCPLQLLIVGDPLASPFARTLPARLLLVPTGTNDQYSFLLDTPLPHAANRVTLDGQEVAVNTIFPWRTPKSSLSAGYHELRVTLTTTGTVANHGQAMSGFEHALPGRQVQIKPPLETKMDYQHPPAITITCAEKPASLAVYQGWRLLAELPAATQTIWQINTRQTGAGPVSIQVLARYPDKSTVRSAPLRINLEPMNRPPQLDNLVVQTNNSSRIFTPVFSDPEGDVVSCKWAYSVTDWLTNQIVQAGSTCAAIGPGGSIQRLGISNTNTLLLDGLALEDETYINLVFSLPLRDPAGYQVGIVFNYKNPAHYSFWGLHGDSSSWVCCRVDDGTPSIVMQQGRPVRPEVPYHLRLAKTRSGPWRCSLQPETLGGEMPFIHGASVGFLFRGPAVDIRTITCWPPLQGNGRVDPEGRLHSPGEPELAKLRLFLYDSLDAYTEAYVPALRP